MAADASVRGKTSRLILRASPDEEGAVPVHHLAATEGNHSGQELVELAQARDPGEDPLRTPDHPAALHVVFRRVPARSYEHRLGRIVAIVTAAPARIPAGLEAPGTSRVPFEPLLPIRELPEGMMRRVTRGDLDLLLAHTPAGIVAVDDRCPHMSAPLSIGELDGCVVGCPLHGGRFDLRHGGPVRMPTTGGLDPDGVYHPPWSPAEAQPKTDVPGQKAEARRLTRVRRLRYYPVRISDGMIEVALPLAPDQIFPSRG